MKLKSTCFIYLDKWGPAQKITITDLLTLWVDDLFPPSPNKMKGPAVLSLNLVNEISLERVVCIRVPTFEHHSIMQTALWYSDVWLSYGPESRRKNLLLEF